MEKYAHTILLHTFVSLEFVFRYSVFAFVAMTVFVCICSCCMLQWRHILVPNG